MKRNSPAFLLLLIYSFAAWGQAVPGRKLLASSYSLMQGVWAASKDENAEFRVRGKLIYYTDFQNAPVRFTISSTTLTIYNEGVPNVNRIRKLTSDSLVYVNSTGFVVRLYKRK